MKVTITEFRKDLFHLVESALQGKPVEITYKGKSVRLVPKEKISRFDRITPIQIFHPNSRGLEGADEEIFAEMEKEWTKDWDE